MMLYHISIPPLKRGIAINQNLQWIEDNSIVCIPEGVLNPYQPRHILNQLDERE